MAGTATISWIGNLAAVGLVAVNNTNVSANNVSSTTLAGVTAGAFMVLTCAAADECTVATTVTISGTSLTWTKRVANPCGSHSGSIEIWTAPCPSGGTVSPTCTWGGTTTNASSSVLYAITGQEASPGGTSGSQQLGATPSVAVTTARDNSLLFCVTSDWNAVNTAPTYRDSAVQVLLDNTHPAAYIGYHYYKLTTTLGGYTEGLSAPGGQSSGTGVYEVRVP